MLGLWLCVVEWSDFSWPCDVNLSLTGPKIQVKKEFSPNILYLLCCTHEQVTILYNNECMLNVRQLYEHTHPITVHEILC